MAYGDTIGVDEARLDAFVSLLQGQLTALNNALDRGTLLPSGLVTSGMVIVGDPETLPKVGQAPVLITVAGGGKSEGLDIEDEAKWVGEQSVSTRKQVFHTQVRAYVHPHLFPTGTAPTWAEVVAQTASRERCCSRLADWLRYVFGRNQGTTITLASNEQGFGADTLSNGRIRELRKMWFDKGFEGSVLVYGAAALIEHTLN